MWDTPHRIGSQAADAKLDLSRSFFPSQTFGSSKSIIPVENAFGITTFYQGPKFHLNVFDHHIQDHLIMIIVSKHVTLASGS